MERDQQEGQSGKPIDRPLAKALIAAGASLVLVVGALLRPTPSPHAPPAEPVAPILEEEVQRREPGRVFRAVRETGQRVASYAVAFHAPPAAEDRYRTAPDVSAGITRTGVSGFGLPVSDDGQVLTHRSALGHGDVVAVIAVTAEGATVRPEVVAYDAETGLTLVRLPGVGLTTPQPAERSPEPGELVVAAARAGGRNIVSPRFVSSVAPGEYVLAAGGLPPGTPVFDLEGHALGVSGSPDPGIVLAIGDGLERLRTLLANGRGMPITMGLVLQDADKRLATRLGHGMIVADVVAGGPAEKAGIRPGDVMAKLGGSALGDLDDALARIAALQPEHEVEVVVRRGGREQAMTVRAEPTLADPDVPAARSIPAAAPTASDLFSSDELAAAGVPVDARVLAVESRPPAGRELARQLRRRGPPWLVHFHDGRRPFFALVGGREGS